MRRDLDSLTASERAEYLAQVREAKAAWEAAYPETDAQETKMARMDDLDPNGYFYVRTGLGDVTTEKIDQAARGFVQANKDLGIPLDAFLTLVWVKRVSAEEYKQAGSRAESNQRHSVQGWYDTRDGKIRIDVNGPDIERTALHEAFHMHQHRQGHASGFDRQAEAEAEAYAQKACPPRHVLTQEEREQARLEAAYTVLLQPGEWEKRRERSLQAWEELLKKGAA